MSDWSPSDGGSKRRAEHTLQVASKRHHLGDVNPGREYVEPRVYQQPNYSCDHQQHEVRVCNVLAFCAEAGRTAARMQACTP
jgi:hypothetical protein